MTSADIQATVADNARFNLFAMVDAALTGDAAGAFRMFHGLRAEGSESAVILWALSREVRLLYSCRLALDAGEQPNAVMKANRVWDSRKSVIDAALRRHNRAALEALMQQAADSDRAIKGLSPDAPWDCLSQLLLSLSASTTRAA